METTRNTGTSETAELKYVSTDLGPFEVTISDKDDKFRSLGTIARMLCKFEINFSNVTKNGRNKFAVTFKNYKDANAIITDPRIRSEKLKASIPRYKLIRKALVREVPTEVGIEEIIDTINKENRELHVVDAYRLRKRSFGAEKVEFIDTETVCVFLRSQLLPKQIIMWRCLFNLKPFVNQVRICNNCFKIGDTQKSCRNTSKCLMCNKDKHAEGTQCNVTPTCINCGENHRSNDRSCPLYIQHQQINKIMAFDNVSFQEAKKRCIIQGSNGLGTRHGMDSMDLREFPSLQPIPEQQESIMRNVFGDSEGRAATNNSRIRKGGYSDIVTSTPNQRHREKDTTKLTNLQDISKIIEELQATEGTDGASAQPLIEALIGELVRRILTFSEKSSFIARLFKTAELHSKHGSKEKNIISPTVELS